jgi:hypothetical protein
MHALSGMQPATGPHNSATGQQLWSVQEAHDKVAHVRLPQCDVAPASAVAGEPLAGAEPHAPANAKSDIKAARASTTKVTTASRPRARGS